MKKGNPIVSDQLPGTIVNLFNSGKNLGQQDFLLFIVDTEEGELQAVNHYASSYFKNVLGEDDSETSFFEDTLHPEDYPLFLHYLRRCSDLKEDQAVEISLRLRSPFGYWKKFYFKYRKYTGFGQSDSCFALCIARPIDSYRYPSRKSKVGNLEAEKDLQESLNRYRALVSSLDEGFCVVEMIIDMHTNPIDYLYVEVNPAFEGHTNLKDVVGKTMREFAVDHEAFWFQRYGKVALTGESHRFESYAGAMNKWFDVFAFPIGNKRSRKVAVLCSDITTRIITEQKLKKANETLEYKVKKRTQALKENNTLLQMVFDTVNQGIFLLKPFFGENYDICDFTYVRVNRVINRYYRENHMIGRSFLDLNPQATHKGVFEILKQTMLTGESKDFEVGLERNGKFNWFRIITRRQKGLLVNSLENITRDKIRAQRLKDNIRFKKQLIGTSPDIILIFNLYEEKIRYANRALSLRQGMTLDKVIGMPLLEILPLIHPEDRQKALEFHTRLTQASDNAIVELEFRLRGTERAWECFNARGKVFMRNKNGKVYEYIVLLRNVQEQKRTQQALVHAEKLSIKGEIARTLAHELRSPLASIGMSAEILDKKMDPGSKKALDNYIEIIKRSTSTLNNLVNDLLNSSNYSPAQLKRCCLARITNTALAHARDRIYLTGVKVVRNYTGPYYINADEEKLKISLLNIIVNASEAMTPEEGVLSIGIKKDSDTFVLSITDNGCGMEENELERLFESFYTKKPGGMGVGLSSVKAILEEHDAGIRVKSKIGEGTTFVLSFPCYQD